MRLVVLVLTLIACCLFGLNAVFFEDHVVYEMEVRSGDRIPLGVEIISGDFDSLTVSFTRVNWGDILSRSKLKIAEEVPLRRTVLLNLDPPVVEDTERVTLYVYSKGEWFEIIPPHDVFGEIEGEGRVDVRAPGTWKGVYRLEDRVLSLTVYVFSPFLQSATVFVSDGKRTLEIGEVQNINRGVWKRVFQSVVDFKEYCRIRIGASSGIYRAERILEIENTRSNGLGWDLPDGKAIIEDPETGVISKEYNVHGSKEGGRLLVDLGKCEGIYARSEFRGEDLRIVVVNSSGKLANLELIVETMGRILSDSDPVPDRVSEDEIVFETEIDTGLNTFNLRFRSWR